MRTLRTGILLVVAGVFAALWIGLDAPRNADASALPWSDDPLTSSSPSATHELAASGMDWVGASRSIECTPAEARVEGAGASLEVTLLDEQGRALLGTRASLSAHECARVGVADAVGRVVFEALPLGRALRLEVGDAGRGAEPVELAAFVAGEHRDLGNWILALRAEVQGFVVDATGAGVSGAEVLALTPASAFDRRIPGEELGARVLQSTRCDSEGRFAMAGLQAGTLALCVRAPGFLDGHVEPLELHASRREPVEVHLQRGASQTGRVLDTAGRPLAGAWVAPLRSRLRVASAECARYLAEHATRTELDGRFELTGLAPFERGRLLCAAEAHVTRWVDLERPGESLEVSLAPAATLAGSIHAQGQPAGGAALELIGLSPDLLAESRLVCGPDGSFRFTGLAEGRYELRVQSAHGVGTFSCEVTPPLTTAQFDLVPGPALAVRCRDLAGAPLSGLTVGFAWAEEIGGGLPGQRVERFEAVTDADGSTQFYGLMRGRWRVCARNGVELLWDEELEISSLPDEIELTIARPGALTVEVVDAGGRALGALPLELHRLAPGSASPTELPEQARSTDPQGRATWTSLRPAVYLVRARPRDLWSALDVSAARRAASACGRASVRSAETTHARLQLAEPVLELSVRRAGMPAAGACVAAAPVEEQADLRVALSVSTRLAEVCDSAGSARLLLPAPGDYVVAARASALAPWSTHPVTVAEDGAWVELELSGACVSGVFVDTHGAPVAGLRTRLVPELLGSERERLLIEAPSEAAAGGQESIEIVPGETVLFTDSHGVFRFQDVPSGEYRLSIDSNGHAAFTTDPMRVAGPTTVSLGLLTLHPRCSLIVRVLGTTEHRDAVLRLLDAEGAVLWTKSPRPDGRVEAHELAPGRYQLVVELHDDSFRTELFDVSPGRPTIQDVDLVRHFSKDQS